MATATATATTRQSTTSSSSVAHHHHHHHVVASSDQQQQQQRHHEEEEHAKTALMTPPTGGATIDDNNNNNNSGGGDVVPHEQQHNTTSINCQENTNNNNNNNNNGDCPHQTAAARVAASRHSTNIITTNTNTMDSDNMDMNNNNNNNNNSSHHEQRRHHHHHEQVGLCLSPASTMSGSPSPPTNDNNMIPTTTTSAAMARGMAKQVSEEALLAAADAASGVIGRRRQDNGGNGGSGSGAIVDASLLPQPRPLVDAKQEQQQQQQELQQELQQQQQQQGMVQAPPSPPLFQANPNNPSKNPITVPAAATTTTTGTTTIPATGTIPADPVEARMMQLERSLTSLTQLCQNLIVQNQQQQQLQSQQQQQQQSQQQQQQHQQQLAGGSREGSEETDDSISPGNLSPNTTSPNSSITYRPSNDESDSGLLSQWPPTHHRLLESPDTSMRSSQKLSAKFTPQRRSSRSGSSFSGRALASKGKTMSMMLLDINPGDSRGPSMIPFTTDLDACDEMDGDSVAGGCRDGRSRRGISTGDVSSAGERSVSGHGRDSPDSENLSSLDGSFRSVRGEKKRQSSPDADGGANSSSNESSSASSSRRRHRQNRRLSSSMKEPSYQLENNLECQAYTTTHLEALRLRREAGKGRAHSFNDALLPGSAPDSTKDTADLSNKQQWTPTLDTLDGSIAPDSAMSVSTIDSFVGVRERESNGEEVNQLDIIMPDLSLPDASSSKGCLEDQGLDRKELAQVSSPKNAAKQSEAVNTATAAFTTAEKIIAHSTSCASNMSSQTLKSGNTNAHLVFSARNQKSRSDSTASSGTPSKERAQSTSSSKSGGSTSAVAKEGSTVTSSTGDDVAAALALAPTPRKGNGNSKGKSPHKSHTHSSNEKTSSTHRAKSPRKNSSNSEQQPDATAITVADNKNNQTMRDYFFNELLNIDSRNQDGSATEDIDANMEEFLRIPWKLEGLMWCSLAICIDSFLYAWAMLPLKFVWGWICLLCSVVSFGKGVRGVRFHRRHLYPMMQSVLIYFVYSQVLCPISIGKLYHWIRGQAMLKLYVLIAIVEVFDRLMCSFGQDAWDSLYWNTTRRPWHPRMFVSIIVVGLYVTIHSLFLFVHVATLSVAVNSADNALLSLLISGNFAEIKSTVFKKYNKQNLFKITTSDICERFKLALFLLLILFLNRFQGEMTSSMVKDYYTMCGIVFGSELISDWIKHSFITKFNLIKSTIYFDYALVLSGDVTGIGHEEVNLDYTHAVVKRLGLAQIPLVCVTARYLNEAVRFAIAFQGNGDVGHPVAALVDLMADGNKLKFYTGLLQGMAALVLFKITLGMSIKYVATHLLGGASNRVLKAGGASSRKSSSTSAAQKAPKESNDVKKKQ